MNSYVLYYSLDLFSIYESYFFSLSSFITYKYVENVKSTVQERLLLSYGHFFSDWGVGRRQERFWTSSERTESEMWCDWETRSRTSYDRGKKTRRGNTVSETNKPATEGVI